MRRIIKHIVVFLLAAIIICGFKTFAPTSPEKYKAQSIFIYTFTKYITWTKSSGENFTIVSYKNCDINSYLQQLSASKKVNDKNISVVIIDVNSAIPACDLFYFDDKNSTSAKAQLAKTNTSNMLVVSQCKNIPTDYSCINLLEVSNSYKFEIHKGNLTKSGLTASSNLLKLAIKIYE